MVVSISRFLISDMCTLTYQLRSFLKSVFVYGQSKERGFPNPFCLSEGSEGVPPSFEKTIKAQLW